VISRRHRKQLESQQLGSRQLGNKQRAGATVAEIAKQGEA